eukprot:7789758-Heterocapsa_arctica.AAC.1
MMTPLDSEDMAYPVAFELCMEYGNEHNLQRFRQVTGAAEQKQSEDRDTAEQYKHQNEGQHHSDFPGPRTQFQATATLGAFGHAGHRQFYGSRAERFQHGRLCAQNPRATPRSMEPA